MWFLHHNYRCIIWLTPNILVLIFENIYECEKISSNLLFENIYEYEKRDNCIFTPSWFLPTGFALTFWACSVLPLFFPSRSLKCPLTVWPKIWKFITNSYELRKMQIRYQNVQINITFMGRSFALRKKASYKLPEVINVINIIKNKYI